MYQFSSKIISKSNCKSKVIWADLTSDNNQNDKKYYVQFANTFQNTDDIPPESAKSNVDTIIAKQPLLLKKKALEGIKENTPSSHLVGFLADLKFMITETQRR